MTRAASCALASPPALKEGRAIGCFGFAAPTMRMIGTEGMGASGGGEPPEDWASRRVEPRTSPATSAVADEAMRSLLLITSGFSLRSGPASVAGEGELELKGEGRPQPL